MPTYDYVCDACEHKFEAFQGITEEKLTKCPECKKNKLRRLFGTGGAIVFKGSGFYQTDYRSDAYKKSAEADRSSSSESKSSGSESKSSGGESKSSGSSESKPKSDKPAKNSSD